VTSHTIDFPGQEMRIPAAGNRKFDFLITREDIPSSEAVDPNPRDEQAR